MEVFTLRGDGVVLVVVVVVVVLLLLVVSSVLLDVVDDSKAVCIRVLLELTDNLSMEGDALKLPTPMLPLLLASMLRPL